MSAIYDHPRDTNTLPHSIESEQNVIGGLMLANDSLSEVAGWLGADDFYQPEHAAIYAAMLEFAAAEPPKPFDVVTLGDHFTASENRSVTFAYLVELAATTASVANICAYAEIVREKAQLRRLVSVGTALTGASMRSRGQRSDEIAMEATASLLALSDGAKPRGPATMREVAGRWLDDIEQRYASDGGMAGLPTPWAKLNRMTLSLCAGDLVIVAGRPSMGKSAVAVNLATSAGLSGRRVMFFNLEMTATSIFSRCVASVGEVPLKELRSGVKGEDSEEYWPRLIATTKRLRDADLIIDDTPGLTAAQIVARAKRAHLRKPVNLLIVDHLHLMKLPGGERTDREIGDATAALKNLGKALGCPVVLLSQLNRGLEGRPNKRPQMQDLRESGSIEQDADLILFLYRDDYYAVRDGRASEYPGMVEMFIAKQREGEAGHTVWMRDRLDIGLLEDHDGEYPVRLRSEGKAVQMVNRNTGHGRAAGCDA